MATDPFEEAGKSLRREMMTDLSARDRGVTALSELEKLFAQGIGKFYGTSSPDAYVERFGDSQLSIRFGLRAGKLHRVLQGPYAVILVKPDGTLLWAETDGWHPSGSSDSDLQATALEPDLNETGPARLIEFLKKAERQYKDATA